MNLFPSTLIIAKNKETIDTKIGQICSDLNHKFNQNNPDILLINQDSGWGIDQIRKISNFLSQKPFSHQSKIIIILEAQNLNIEAQNALLKILEEPGKDNYVILSTNKVKSILPTIISRCQTIKLVRVIHELPKTEKKIDITGNLIKDLILSEKLGKNKEDILPLLENQLYFYQQELIKNPNKKNNYLIEKIIKAIQMINANVDPRNALDFIFLS
jgi:DNA polymerase III delta prime subunit